MGILHVYEDRLIRLLPPNAQYLSEILLGRSTLVDLLRMQDHNEIDLVLLEEHHVNASLWSDILRATILAKVTYFEPTEFLDQDKIVALVRIAVKAAGFSLSTPLPQVVSAVKTDYPRLTYWLMTMAQRLGKVRSETK